MDSITCKQCGAENPADSGFCGSCGTAFTPNDPVPAQPQPPITGVPTPGTVPPPGHTFYQVAPTAQPSQPGPYGPPAYGQQPAPFAGGAYQGYQQLQGDGNNSGMGMDYPLPLQAQGWTWAGFVPYGLFAFFNGNVLWGVIGLFVPIVYYIYIGIKGKELAWKGRRFLNEQQFVETMGPWNTWGLVLFIIGVISYGLYFISVLIMVFAMGTGMYY